jgi:hypothetical protein
VIGVVAVTNGNLACAHEEVSAVEPIIAIDT